MIDAKGNNFVSMENQQVLVVDRELQSIFWTWGRLITRNWTTLIDCLLAIIGGSLLRPCVVDYAYTWEYHVSSHSLLRFENPFNCFVPVLTLLNFIPCLLINQFLKTKKACIQLKIISLSLFLGSGKILGSCSLNSSLKRVHKYHDIYGRIFHLVNSSSKLYLYRFLQTWTRSYSLNIFW